jgi:hypothetical protein
MKVISIKAKASPLRKSISTAPTLSNREILLKTHAATAYQMLIADLRKLWNVNDLRKPLDEIFIRANAERHDGRLTEQQYHQFSCKWHAALVSLMKHGNK